MSSLSTLCESLVCNVLRCAQCPPLLPPRAGTHVSRDSRRVKQTRTATGKFLFTGVSSCYSRPPTSSHNPYKDLSQERAPPEAARRHRSP
jgi:hypothetical protein